MRAARSHAPADDSALPDGWERARLERQLAELDRLADMGMALAGAIHRRVTEDDGSASVADLQHAAIDFSRVARAVRLTFALQSRLIAEFKAPAGAARAAGAATGERQPLEVRWIGQLSPAEKARRERLKRVVRTVAESEGRDAETVERLALDAAERVEDDEIFGDMMARPFAEIVAVICQDLGLKPDWDSFADEVWAEAPDPPEDELSPYEQQNVWRQDRGKLALKTRYARARASSP